MNKKTFIGGTFAAVAAIVAASSFISCSSDAESDDYYYNLDVTSRTPTTRSLNTEIEGCGATQTFGNQPPSNKTIPTYNGECMLWSILNVALEKKTEVPYINNQGKTEYRKIGNNYPASDAYDYVKGLALGQQWYEQGDNGQSICNTYQGGAMPISIAADIAGKSGIMEGITVQFDTYDELYKYITNPSWSEKHPAGTYIINNNTKNHASVCIGTTKGGDVRLKTNPASADNQDKRYSSEKNGEDGYVLMY